MVGGQHKLHHIKCKPDDIAPYVLLPGDPNRAKIVAEKYLDKSQLVNEFRGLIAYTGMYHDIKISVVTTGMGCPSACIVLEELCILGIDTAIRIGTCGAIQKDIPPGSIIIPTGAVPLCGILHAYELEPLPPVPDFHILRALSDAAVNLNINHITGIVATSDAFYREIPQARIWEKRNVVAFEMECAGLFAIGMIKGIKVGAIVAATGNILYGEQVMETEITAKAIADEIKIALEAIRILHTGSSR
jgi:purine-nucleoside phosphorylase